MTINADNSFTIIHDDLKRIVKSAEMLQDVSDPNIQDPSTEPENVKRFLDILDETKWNTISTKRNTLITFADLVKLVKTYPQFCGESVLVTSTMNAADTESTLKRACAMEISTLFAHIVQDTGLDPNSDDGWLQGFHHLKDTACPAHSDCQTFNNSHQFYEAPSTTLQFYGRGSLLLKHNFFYGMFSQDFLGSRHYLLKYPERVENEGWLALASAFWIYMNPVPPVPSMHSLITGFWEGNDFDLNQAKLIPGFGATIVVLKENDECGWGYESTPAINRRKVFVNFMNYFQEPLPNALELQCGEMNAFQTNGAYNPMIYWDKDWASSTGMCKLVTWFTPFNLMDADSLKNCILWVAGQEYDPG